jgi:hypothetical protein
MPAAIGPIGTFQDVLSKVDCVTPTSFTSVRPSGVDNIYEGCAITYACATGLTPAL